MYAGDLWLVVSRHNGLEHWELVASNCLVTPPAPGEDGAVEVLNLDTGETRCMQPHFVEYVHDGDEDCIEVRVEMFEPSEPCLL